MLGVKRDALSFTLNQMLTIHQGVLYEWHTPMGKIEEILRFVIPKMHIR